MADGTLIVVAAYDQTHTANLETLHGGTVIVKDTSGGGHPTKAFIDAYREHPDHAGYLFVQDSMRGTEPDVVEMFRERERSVVAWVTFPLFFDSTEQAEWVRAQYPGHAEPMRGIFGPTFYATRAAMQAAEPFFPLAPDTKMMAQGTERAWAYCFNAAQVDVAGLHQFDPGRMSDGSFPPFQKHFANRQ